MNLFAGEAMRPKARALGLLLLGGLLAWGLLAIGGYPRTTSAATPPPPVPIHDGSSAARESLAADIYAALVASRPCPLGRQPADHLKALAAEARTAADIFLASQPRKDDEGF